jgi:hypothetical protein
MGRSPGAEIQLLGQRQPRFWSTEGKAQRKSMERHFSDCPYLNIISEEWKVRDWCIKRAVQDLTPNGQI